jgi:hypothetical protein
MHQTAFNNAIQFVKKYCPKSKGLNVLDVGSYDINGCMKPLFPDAEYIGMDMEDGPNVDLVSSAHNIPLSDNSQDVVVSSSCFEHDPMFWLSFLEMSRVLKPKGFMYINAPSAGHYHPYPNDCWRFYADSWKSLAEYGQMSGLNVSLIESYIDKKCFWHNSVGIFTKK